MAIQHLTVERTLNRYAGLHAYIGKPPIPHNDHRISIRVMKCRSCGRTACSCAEAGL